MPCTTCRHTVQNIGVPEKRIFWCPRCGTLKTCAPGRAPDGSELAFDEAPKWTADVNGLDRHTLTFGLLAWLIFGALGRTETAYCFQEAQQLVESDLGAAAEAFEKVQTWLHDRYGHPKQPLRPLRLYGI